jgi:hypothetical protein
MFCGRGAPRSRGGRFERPCTLPRWRRRPLGGGTACMREAAGMADTSQTTICPSTHRGESPRGCSEVLSPFGMGLLRSCADAVLPHGHEVEAGRSERWRALLRPGEEHQVQRAPGPTQGAVGLQANARAWQPRTALCWLGAGTQDSTRSALLRARRVPPNSQGAALCRWMVTGRLSARTLRACRRDLEQESQQESHASCRRRRPVIHYPSGRGTVAYANHPPPTCLM